jgi:hypothetical protein
MTTRSPRSGGVPAVGRPSGPSGRGAAPNAAAQSRVRGSVRPLPLAGRRRGADVAAAAESRVTVEDLVVLFAGDADTQACPHVNLVVAICEQVRPRSAQQLFDLLYGGRGEAPDEPSDRIVRWGHELWLQRVYERDPREWHQLVSRTE